MLTYLRRGLLIVVGGSICAFFVLVALSLKARQEVAQYLCPFKGAIVARWPDSAAVRLETGRVVTIRLRSDSSWTIEKGALKGICREPGDTLVRS